MRNTFRTARFADCSSSSVIVAIVVFAVVVAVIAVVAVELVVNRATANSKCAGVIWFW